MRSSDMPTHTSHYVAPLHIQKHGSRSTSRSPDRQQCRSDSSHSRSQSTKSRHNGQMTPPLTPSKACFEPQTAFQTYLRAFYPYHPTCEEGSSTQILPLNSGDLILIHSIHTNGWADGTLLMSGARGWLPTNYCEGYDNEPISTLLRALTLFWDLVKSNDGDPVSFQHSDYVRGLVAGVRCMLVSFLIR